MLENFGAECTHTIKYIQVCQGSAVDYSPQMYALRLCIKILFQKEVQSNFNHAGLFNCIYTPMSIYFVEAAMYMTNV